MDICLNLLFLRILYYFKLALNIIRIVIPIGLILKVILDIYKQVLNPSEEDGKKAVIKRVVAAIIIFLVPTIVSVIISITSEALNLQNSGINQCLEFADMKYIKLLEIEHAAEDLEKYLSDEQKKASEREKFIMSLKEIVKSEEDALKLGTPASKNNLIKCNSGSSYNTRLFNNVRTAGYKTREGVVAAAIYLSSHIDVHIPYFWSGGHFHNYYGYNDSGENFIGVPDKWGCDVKMAFGGTGKQKDGVAYPFGIDCSGFVTWSIYNGGYYNGNKNQELYISTDSKPPTAIGGLIVEAVPIKSSKGKVKPGDIAFKSGHVGMVVAVNDNYLTIAEEKGYNYGLVVSEVKYTGFTHIILMDNFYNNFNKSLPLWSGFK